MEISHYRYPVRLSEEQHQWLEAMVRMGSTPAKHYLVARVLLMSEKPPRGTQPHRWAGGFGALYQSPRNDLYKRTWKSL